MKKNSERRNENKNIEDPIKRAEALWWGASEGRLVLSSRLHTLALRLLSGTAAPHGRRKMKRHLNVHQMAPDQEGSEGWRGRESQRGGGQVVLCVAVISRGDAGVWAGGRGAADGQSWK